MKKLLLFKKDLNDGHNVHEILRRLQIIEITKKERPKYRKIVK